VFRLDLVSTTVSCLPKTTFMLRLQRQPLLRAMRVMLQLLRSTMLRPLPQP
jgi:hypothetical protein